MLQFKNLINNVFDNGIERTDRTGVGTRSVFGHQMRFDLSEGFPLVTGKKTVIRSIIHELLWFLNGDTNIKYLNDNNVHIWDEWADSNGDLGPVYGSQWRSWEHYVPASSEFSAHIGTIDQISNVINQIRNNPDSRRLIVTAWNPSEIQNMALPPCHCLFQFYCTPMDESDRLLNLLSHSEFEAGDSIEPEELQDLFEKYNIPKYKLSCQLYQRSADVFLGVPFNIASYSLLIMMIAKITNMTLGEFIWTGGDCHIYQNHYDQIHQYMMSEIYPIPYMEIAGDQKEIEDFKFEDFILHDYKHGPFISAPIAV